MARATSITFAPKGPYSLAASIRYLEGFAPAAYDSESAASLEMAFCVDGFWDPVEVHVHEESGAVHGTVYGGDTLAPAAIAAAAEQVERILSLDIDGRGFPDIARHDPVVAKLQLRYPGAADLGDLPAQAAALMNLATGYIDKDQLDDAEAVVTQVRQVFELMDAPRDDQARLLVIRGNIAAARRDLDTARSHFLSAAELSTGAERIESEGAALWTLAQDGQRDKYRRLLQRVIRVGQRDKLDGTVAKAILPSAEAWLNSGVTNLSARTYAAAIVLALVQWSNSQPVTTEPNAGDLSSGADSVMYVIARMVSDLSSVPSLRPLVMTGVLAHLRNDLPDQLDEIVATWIEESAALLAAGESPPDGAR